MRVSNNLMSDTVMGNMQRNLEKLLDLQSSAADRNTMAMEVEQLYEQVRQIANTKYDNRYIFAGLKTDVAPYDNTGSYTGTASNGGYIDVEIDAGITMSVNMPGYAVFGSATDGTDVLAALSDLKTAMESNDTVAIEGAMTNLDSGMDQVSDALSYIGARLNRLDIAKNHFDTMLFDLAKYKSDTEDADITNIISQLALQETMLAVSRATAAKVLQQSILDFMR